MASRQQRRKRIERLKLAKSLRIAEAAKAYDVQQIVRKNMSTALKPVFSGTLSSHASRWTEGYSAFGASGKRVYETDKEFVQKPRR